MGKDGNSPVDEINPAYGTKQQYHFTRKTEMNLDSYLGFQVVNPLSTANDVKALVIQRRLLRFANNWFVSLLKIRPLVAYMYWKGGH